MITEIGEIKIDGNQGQAGTADTNSKNIRTQIFTPSGREISDTFYSTIETLRAECNLVGLQFIRDGILNFGSFYRNPMNYYNLSRASRGYALNYLNMVIGRFLDDMENGLISQEEGR